MSTEANHLLGVAYPLVEVFELRLAIWDSGGHIFDSLVLLDGWEWSVEAAKPGLEPPE